ncbi:uncharacterized protein LOC130614621 [Hydractinia symbiolongicarpus]|uniref:uncharacterized protein LOC130614621 n=1 Tax=Hydractinia symbiolongicarpus TaxID=13093 RepID=UPI00254B01C3|nr:uncharacterized protein LOC130614621 [Hydractinia symbiolongicarpus]
MYNLARERKITEVDREHVKKIRTIGVLHIANSVILIGLGLLPFLSAFEVISKRSACGLWGGMLDLGLGVTGIILCRFPQFPWLAIFHTIYGFITVLSSAAMTILSAVLVGAYAKKNRQYHTYTWSERIYGPGNEFDIGLCVYGVILIFGIIEIALCITSVIYGARMCSCNRDNAYKMQYQRYQMEPILHSAAPLSHTHIPTTQGGLVLSPQSAVVQSLPHEQPQFTLNNTMNMPVQTQVITNAAGQHFMVVPLAMDGNRQPESSSLSPLPTLKYTPNQQINASEQPHPLQMAQLVGVSNAFQEVVPTFEYKQNRSSAFIPQIVPTHHSNTTPRSLETNPFQQDFQRQLVTDPRNFPNSPLNQPPYPIEQRDGASFVNIYSPSNVRSPPSAFQQIIPHQQNTQYSSHQHIASPKIDPPPQSHGSQGNPNQKHCEKLEQVIPLKTEPLPQSQVSQENFNPEHGENLEQVFPLKIDPLLQSRVSQENLNQQHGENVEKVFPLKIDPPPQYQLQRENLNQHQDGKLEQDASSKTDSPTQSQTRQENVNPPQESMLQQGITTHLYQ